MQVWCAEIAILSLYLASLRAVKCEPFQRQVKYTVFQKTKALDV